MSVVFLQSEDAATVLDMIDETGPEAAIRHLSQWDYGDETRDAALVNGYVYDEIPHSFTDRVIRRCDGSGYALTYKPSLRIRVAPAPLRSGSPGRARIRGTTGAIPV